MPPNFMKARSLLLQKYLTTLLSLAMPMPSSEVTTKPVLVLEYLTFRKKTKKEETKKLLDLIKIFEESRLVAMKKYHL